MRRVIHRAACALAFAVVGCSGTPNPSDASIDGDGDAVAPPGMGAYCQGGRLAVGDGSTDPFNSIWYQPCQSQGAGVPTPDGDRVCAAWAAQFATSGVVHSRCFRGHCVPADTCTGLTDPGAPSCTCGPDLSSTGCGGDHMGLLCWSQSGSAAPACVSPCM
jgi:hypothetical protein